jgi:hypothetical protein
MFKLAIALLIAASSLAQAADCGPMLDILKQLREKYQEVPAFTAVLGPGHVLTITVSPSGSWTAIGQQTAGSENACIMASGNTWSIAPPAKIIQNSAPILLRNGQRLI